MNILWEIALCFDKLIIIRMSRKLAIWFFPPILYTSHGCDFYCFMPSLVWSLFILDFWWFFLIVQKIKILEAKSFPLPKSGARLMLYETIEHVKYHDALIWKLFLVCFIQLFSCKKSIKTSQTYLELKLKQQPKHVE